MKNFNILDKSEHQEVWSKFYTLFNFKPNINTSSAIKTASPQLKFDIKECLSADYSVNKLETLALNLFKKISTPGERIYALDWQHDCYDFDPRQEIDRNEFDEWVIPVFPNGDYYIFLTKDFNNVWFGHPWEKTITLIGRNIVEYGQQMIVDFETIKITLFTK